MKLDTHRQVETPEGLALGLRLAGVMPRAMATLTDVALRIAFYAITIPILIRFGMMGEALISLLVFGLEWFYYVIFEVWFDGATPGKKWLGIRVLHDDGTPVGLSASVVRNFLRFVDFLPAAYGIGIMSALSSPGFRRVGDWAAGTVVVYKDVKVRQFKIAPKSRRRGAQIRPEPLPLVLDREESAALLEFFRRESRWSTERAEELSDLLQPITQQSGKPGLQKVLSYGAWLEEGA